MQQCFIDLRSDTVTRPDAGMLAAMNAAPVGDDVLGDDPTVIEMERTIAAYFGMEAAIFCPSGTMTNQIAIKLLTKPGDEVICHHYAHIYNYEGGAMGFNSGVQAKLVGDAYGRITAAEVRAAINPDDVHAAHSALLALENTSNKGGGTCFSLDAMAELSAIARSNGLGVHLDGARIWNALVAKNENPLEYGKIFDTISVCMSKGMGCPVGSLLLVPKSLEKEARRIRKKLGGGMRQSGFLAGAALYALEHRLPFLHEDHQKATALANTLKQCAYVAEVVTPETNIVIFKLQPGLDEKIFMEVLRKKGVHILSLGPGKLRMVTHFDVTKKDIELVSSTLLNLEF
jgi:threonine aldolase